MKTNVSMKTGDKPAFARFVGTMAIGAIILVSPNARAALTIDDFDSYSNGALVGQGGWISTGADTTVGFNVVDGANPISSPKVAQIDDSTNLTLAIRNNIGLGGIGTYVYYARHLTNDLNNSSGLSMQLNATVNQAGASPDPFFTVGFSSSSPGILWNFHDGGATTDGLVNNIITTGTWYRFEINYNITNSATHYVTLRVDDLDTSSAVVNQAFTITGNQGGRFFLGSIEVRTGSSHNPSLFELDSLAVPEPSSVALMLAGGLLMFKRRRS